MVARRRRKAPKRKLSTRFKNNPIGTTKSEFKKLGPLGQIAVIGLGAGAFSSATAQKLNKLPILGQVFQIFTQAGTKFRMKMK